MKLGVPLAAGAVRRSRGHMEVMTVPDVAAYLKLPISTVYRLVCRGELPGYKVGRQWRFHKDALDQWFRSALARAAAAALRRTERPS